MSFVVVPMRICEDLLSYIWKFKQWLQFVIVRGDFGTQKRKKKHANFDDGEPHHYFEVFFDVLRYIFMFIHLSLCSSSLRISAL